LFLYGKELVVWVTQSNPLVSDFFLDMMYYRAGAKMTTEGYLTDGPGMKPVSFVTQYGQAMPGDCRQQD